MILLPLCPCATFTVREWFDELLAETREAGAALNELNVAFSAYPIEDDDFTDPRLRVPDLWE